MRLRQTRAVAGVRSGRVPIIGPAPGGEAVSQEIVASANLGVFLAPKSIALSVAGNRRTSSSCRRSSDANTLSQPQPAGGKTTTAINRRDHGGGWGRGSSSNGQRRPGSPLVRVPPTGIRRYRREGDAGGSDQRTDVPTWMCCVLPVPPTHPVASHRPLCRVGGLLKLYDRTV